MAFENDLKNEIELQYGSIYAFCKTTKISRSTFTRIDKIGIESCSNQTLSKIAKNLGLNYEELKNKKIVYHEYTPEEIAKFESEKIAPVAVDTNNPIEIQLLEAFRNLDFKGQVKTIEYIKDITATYKVGE